MMSNSEDRPSQEESEFLPAIRRARLERLTIYEISETDLELLERGTPDSLYLNFAIGLLSSAVSLTATLATATIADWRIFTIFVVIAVVGYVVGIFLLLLWWRSHRSVSSIVKVIRERLPPEGLEDTAALEE